MLNHSYWVLGATTGVLLGYVIHFDTAGIEFVMTALFVVIFINQWDKTNNHRFALTGLGCSFLCPLLFGSKHFIIPAMAAMILCLSFGQPKNREDRFLAAGSCHSKTAGKNVSFQILWYIKTAPIGHLTSV